MVFNDCVVFCCMYVTLLINYFLAIGHLYLHFLILSIIRIALMRDEHFGI